jgi:hypothetical protein
VAFAALIKFINWASIKIKIAKLFIDNYFKAVVSTLTVFFFLASYHVCQYFYPLDTEDHIDNWWLLKADLYVLIYTLCLSLSFYPNSKIKKIKFISDFMMSFGMGFAISNTIDRWILDNRLFNWTSYYPLAILAFATFYSIKRINKQAEKFAKEL